MAFIDLVRSRPSPLHGRRHDAGELVFRESYE